MNDTIKPRMRIFKKLRVAFGLYDRGAALSELLAQSTIERSLPERMQWFEEVLSWIFRSSDAKLETRIQFLFNILQKNPEWKVNLQETVTSILTQCSLFRLFVQVGIALEHGLWGDLASRFLNYWMPFSETGEIQSLVMRVFRDETRLESLKRLPQELVDQLFNLLGENWSGALKNKIMLEIDESILALSVHLSHYGIGYGVRTRLREQYSISTSSFYSFSKKIQISGALSITDEDFETCRLDVQSVYSTMEQTGVSVDIVNRLETIDALLVRIRELLFVRGEPSHIHVQRLSLGVFKSSIRSQKMMEPLRRHFYLLTRKIAERNGSSGDHYIAKGRKELTELFLSACGGGAIVVVMTILKTLFLHLNPAILIRAVGIWMIYSAGFLAMQFMGFTLATKIPSFVAAKFASLIRERSTSNLLQRELRAAFRSQSLALLGNLIVVVPLALVTGYLLQQKLGVHIMDDDYSTAILSSLHPLLSFAVPLGALTGLQLWFSSLAGGWFENWIVLRKIPENLSADSRLQTLFGQERMNRFSRWIVHHASGFATNIALGFLFGFVPLMGAILGFDWNGHHVTISSASSMFAVAGLEFDLLPSQWVIMASGLILIGLMNFLVSFGLALFVALTSQNVDFFRALKLLFRKSKIKQL